jgi:hypothetical protein
MCALVAIAFMSLKTLFTTKNLIIVSNRTPAETIKARSFLAGKKYFYIP